MDYVDLFALRCKLLKNQFESLLAVIIHGFSYFFDFLDNVSMLRSLILVDVSRLIAKDDLFKYFVGDSLSDLGRNSLVVGNSVPMSFLSIVLFLVNLNDSFG